MRKLMNISVCIVVSTVCSLLMLCFGIESVAGIILGITGVLSVLIVIIQIKHDEHIKAEEKIEEISEELLTDKEFIRIERALNDYNTRYTENYRYRESPYLRVEFDIHTFSLKIENNGCDRSAMERFLRKMNNLARQIRNSSHSMSWIDEKVRNSIFLTVNNPIVQIEFFCQDKNRYRDLLDLSDTWMDAYKDRISIPLIHFAHFCDDDNDIAGIDLNN